MLPESGVLVFVLFSSNLISVLSSLFQHTHTNAHSNTEATEFVFSQIEDKELLHLSDLSYPFSTRTSGLESRMSGKGEIHHLLIFVYYLG